MVFSNNGVVFSMVVLACTIFQVLASDLTNFGTDAGIEVILECGKGLVISPPVIPGRSWWNVQMSLQFKSDEDTLCHNANERTNNHLREVIEHNVKGIEHTVIVADGEAGPFSIAFDLHTRGIHKIALTDEGLSFEFSTGLGSFTYNKLEVFDAEKKPLASQMRLENNILFLDVLEAGVYPITIDPLLAVEFPEGEAYFESVNTLQLATPNSAVQNTQQEYEDILNNGAMFGWKVGSAALASIRSAGSHDIVVGAPQYRATPNPDDNDNLFLGTADKPFEPLIHQIGQILFYKNTGTGTDHTFSNGITVTASIFATASNEAPSIYNSCNSPRFGLNFAIGARTSGERRPASGYDELWSGSLYCQAYVQLIGKSDEPTTNIKTDFDQRMWATGITTNHLVHGVFYRHNYGKTGGTSEMCYAYTPSSAGVNTFSSTCQTAENIQDGIKDVFKLGGAIATHPDMGEYWVVSDYEKGSGRTGAVFVAYIDEDDSAGGMKFGWTAVGDQFNSGFGKSLLLADVNNDGAPDLLVGDPAWSGSTLESGRVHIFLGDVDSEPPTFSTTPDQIIEGKMVNGQFSTSIANLHDINKDGYDDVAISAPYADSGKGRVYVYLGGASGLTLHQTIKGAQAGELFGFSISEGKDMNNDGIPDVVIGAPGFSFNGVSFGGRAAVMYGLKYSDVTIESASSHNPALANTALTTTFTIRNNGPETTPADTIVTMTVPDKTLYGTTVVYNSSPCTQTTPTSFQCTISSLPKDASTNILVTLPFNVNPNLNPQDAALSFKAVLSKKGSILSDVSSELQVSLINQVDLQFVTSATDTKGYAASNSSDLTIGTMPACVNEVVDCSVVADDTILFRGPKIINNGPMDAFGVVMTITHPPDIFYSGDEDCVVGCPTTPATKDYSCTASGAGVTKCVIQTPITNTGSAIAPFEGRHLTFIIPVATSLDSFRFRMSLTTLSTITTDSLPVQSNSITRGESQSSVGISGSSLNTPSGCADGIYAGNKFVANMELLNTAQYSSSDTIVYIEIVESSPFTLNGVVPQITLQKVGGTFASSFCTATDNTQLNWACTVPSGGFVSGNSKDKVIVTVSGKTNSGASGVMDEFVRFTTRVETTTSQNPALVLPVMVDYQFPLCVKSNFQQIFKVVKKTDPEGMPDNSMIYPHANLALIRTLVLINTGPSDSADGFYTDIVIDTAKEAWADTPASPEGCIKQSESTLRCNTGPLTANTASGNKNWVLHTVLKHANIIASEVATSTAQAIPEEGTTATATFDIYHGVDISMSPNGISEIPLGSTKTFVLAITNRHPSTDATDLNITWTFPSNLDLHFDELAFSGYTVEPACEMYLANDTNSENLVPTVTCLGTQPAGSSTRVRIPATARDEDPDFDVAATGLVATARVLSMNEVDTPADSVATSKSVDWNFATTSFADVEVTLIPEYSVVDPDTGVHTFAQDQIVQVQGTIREVGSLATIGLVATLEWDDNFRLLANAERKCDAGAITTNTTWTCNYGSINQTERFQESLFTFAYVVEPSVGDTFSIYWRVESDNDLIPINDGAKVDGEISDPIVDLKISAQISPKTLLPNQEFTVTVLCQNQGPSKAANVTLETPSWPSQYLDMIDVPEGCSLNKSKILCDVPVLVRGGAPVSYKFTGTSSSSIADEPGNTISQTIFTLEEGTIASNGVFSNRAVAYMDTYYQPKETEVPDNSKTTNTIAAAAGCTAIYLAASGIFMLYHAHFFARNPPPETFIEPDVGEL